MTEIILDCNRNILIVDSTEYKYFEINWGYRGDIPLCNICILDGNSIITGIFEHGDVVYIND